MTAGVRSVMLSPAEVARRVGAEFAPTPEQAAVIAAPLEPAVVIAGAGSGKTETMAARVVWLVANGMVEPEQVLGLTFTRKAAGELNHRIRDRLAKWHRATQPGRPLTGDPTVLTYAAYAGQLVAEHAIRLGAEPGARLLSEAARWQVADSVVRNYAGDFTVAPGVVASVTDYVLGLAGQLADHLAEPAAIEDFSTGLMAQLSALAPKPNGRVDWPGYLGNLVNSLRQRVELIPLLTAFAAAKRAEGAMDFADQMVLATQLARLDSVAEIERSRYKVVLLDEYQDTGHAQIEMLAALFADGRSVTAVGDPLQSIYGWRGASANSIRRFDSRFRQSSGEQARLYPLMTSWRNDIRILNAANRIAEDLREATDLPLAPRPGAAAGQVAVTLAPTEAAEAAWIANRLRAEWDGPAENWTSAGRTLAVLVRKRSIIPAVRQALHDQGLPVEVVDLGGLVGVPEVADLVATLRVLVDHSAGGSLARLLTGARLRIAPADLVALHRRARVLAQLAGVSLLDHLHTLTAFAEPAGDTGRGETGRGETGTGDTDGGVADEVEDDRIEPSLVEALDDLGDKGAYSEAGYRRMSDFAGRLRRLRRRLDLPLPDLLDEIERTLGLDVEAAARPGFERVGRANLDRFSDEAARFAGERSASAVAAGSSLVGAFLSYLKAAEDEEYGLKPAAIEVHSDRVQVLTVHGAKGLEWDVVAVAGLCKGGFPSDPKINDWARTRQLLPSALRGDAADLPRLEFGAAAHRGEAERAVNDHHDQLTERHLLEERRLGYVAFTRARRSLYVSGATWGNGIKPRDPSVFLSELSGLDDGTVEVDGWHQPAEGDTNPNLDSQITASWPADPLAERRAAVQAGAELVRTARQQLREPNAVAASKAPVPKNAAESTEPNDAAEPTQLMLDISPTADSAALWRRDVDLLLAEHAAAARSGVIEVALPSHLSASDLVSLSGDEAELARRLRRPVPTRPAKQARRGTAFHSWLEQRWSADTLLDVDELPGAADEVIDDAELESLKAAFEVSEWADRTPVAVEVPFEMTFGGRVVRGRMDAVFCDPDGRYTVVDWKTGKPPTGTDAASKAVQLAVYRLAWAALRGIDGAALDSVGAAFYYVGADVTVSPADLLSSEELRMLING
ncbi:MAG TPA: UvrD-helicase domain-containing protein [Jatrophihabitans sp.]